MDLEIRHKEFLDFLSSAYRVNFQQRDGSDDIHVDWNELASNPLLTDIFRRLRSKNLKNQSDADHSAAQEVKKEHNLKPNSISRSKSVGCLNSHETQQAKLFERLKKNSDANDHLEEAVTILQAKLDEISNEGIFDSILAYVAPSSADRNTKLVSNQDASKVASSSANVVKTRKKDKRKSRVDGKHGNQNETEIEIHVYDEVKGLKKDFKCPQTLLTSNMGYFTEVTKGQKLEDMDISVHCDITVFEWLIRWVKREIRNSNHVVDETPKLDPKNVVPIMVSANFLQMRTLFQDCLYYFKTNVNEVIRFSPNLTCLNDYVLKRLADTLSNVEAESLKDKKDKIKSRIFCQFIISLNEEEPEKHRGHYASTAYLYLCANCSKLVTNASAAQVPCDIQYVTIKCNGDVVSNHLRDPEWNINEHIKNIWMEYKSWGNTYWRLWSQCHFLYCYMCHTMYAVAFADCCLYHPQQPNFYPTEQFQSANSPVGRYPCCGSRALRYQTIMMPSGCKLRSHIPKLQSNDDTGIQSIIDTYPELIKSSKKMENIVTNTDHTTGSGFCDSDVWKKPKLERRSSTIGSLSTGLLDGPLFNTYVDAVIEPKHEDKSEEKEAKSIAKVKEEEVDDKLDCVSIGESENSDASLVRDYCSHTGHHKETLATANQTSDRNYSVTKPSWSSRFSVRHNQDNQRDYEEHVFQTMSQVILKMKGPEDKKLWNQPNCNNFQSGIYTRIESEWKDAHRAKTSCNVKNTKS